MAAAFPLCVIGAGSIGMRHIEVASNLPLIELTAVVEANPGRRAALQQQGLPMVADMADVPSRTKACVIATPTQAHYQNALDAISRGWGGIVEKPLTATIGEARALIHAARAADVPLVTGHHRRCHPFTIEARARLPQIGNLVAVQGLWCLRKHDSYFDASWRRHAGAGVLMTNLSHELDLLRFLIGDISQVSALSSHSQRGLEVEDSSTLALRFASGALGSFLISDAGASPWSFEAGSFENPAIGGTGQDYLRLIGTMGALEFPSLTQWVAGQAGAVEWSKPLICKHGPEIAQVDPIAQQMMRFVRLMEGQSDDVLCSGADGLAAMQATLATALSAKLGRAVTMAEVGDDFRGV